MNITRPHLQSTVRGIALITTILFLGVVLLVFASIFAWVNSNANITARNNQYNMSENAAESAAERVLGQLDRDFIYGSISNSSAYYASLPGSIDQTAWPVQYVFSGTNSADTNAGINTVGVIFAPQNNNVVPLNSEYSGLSGQYQQVDVYATATPVGQRYIVPATVHESLQYANIPLFQFAIFYNVNLEIDPGKPMTINGPVFCNENIWEGSSYCTFASTVTAHGTNAWNDATDPSPYADPFAQNYNGSGHSTFAGGIPVNNAQQLVMPIGTNNSPGAILGLLNLPPTTYAMGTAAAYSSNGIVYPANGADLVISNFVCGTNYAVYPPVGTNLLVYYQDFSLSQVPYDYYIITNGNSHITFPTNYISPTLLGPNTNIYYAGFTWVTNVLFYDWREGWNGGSGPAKPVQAVQIDINLLKTWLTNTAVNGGAYYDSLKVQHTECHISSVYAYTSVPLTGSQLPAVRVKNGAQLPNPGNANPPKGFTVATPFPLYVLGDYNSQNNGLSALGTTNTANTLPAALMGDSITILSDNWHDSVTTKMPSGAQGAADTTVNAAMIEGIVASDPNISGNYSGGVENFMRLLEDWSSGVSGGKQILTYNGSIVVLFYSQYATNSWQETGNYYNPPTRNWSFDLNFNTAFKLPPLTPDSRAMIRGNWFAHN
jgi:hypothetical protein